MYKGFKKDPFLFPGSASASNLLEDHGEAGVIALGVAVKVNAQRLGGKLKVSDRIDGHLAAHSRVDVPVNLQVVLAAGPRFLDVEGLKLHLQRADIPAVPLNQVVAVEEGLVAEISGQAVLWRLNANDALGDGRG